MGTLSKSLPMTGGFVAAGKAVVDMMRWFARSYMFSVALPPAAVARALAALDVLEREPDRAQRLRENIDYAGERLKSCGLVAEPLAAILVLLMPEDLDPEAASRHLDEAGIFVNRIGFPAMPVHQQRFRISVMATHTREDVDRLAICIEEIWSTCCKPPNP